MAKPILRLKGETFNEMCYRFGVHTDQAHPDFSAKEIEKCRKIWCLGYYDTLSDKTTETKTYKKNGGLIPTKSYPWGK